MPGWPALKLGSIGADVANFQVFLNEQKFTDWQGHLLRVDELFGARTEFATKRWQRAAGLSPTGQLAAPDRRSANAMGFISFVQARNYTRVSPTPPRAIDVLVLHTMESAEKPTTAEDVSFWFAGANAPRASAHFCLDQDSTVQCVRESDVAWHAPGANHNGLGIEHAGRAAQTPEQWSDEASVLILERSALLAAKLAHKYKIPIARLDTAALQRKERGLCGHIDVTNAFPGPGRTHWDPGPSFPWALYLGLVAKAFSNLP